MIQRFFSKLERCNFRTLVTFRNFVIRNSVIRNFVIRNSVIRNFVIRKVDPHFFRLCLVYRCVLEHITSLK
jgi:hypothetical protein